MFKINDWISQDSKVLDLGCGDGSLLNDLRKEKSASRIGIEIDAEKIKSCLKKGISVIEQDIDSGLENFGNQSFDYVVMSQSIQALKKPEVALEEIVRIGKECIVSIPNFGYWKVRTKLLFFGKMPVTKTLPNTWYNTPNLHMCTIKDLFNFCDEKKIIIKKVVGVNENKTSLIRKSNLEIKNLFSKVGIFLIS